MQEHLGTTRPEWPQRNPDGTIEHQHWWTPAWTIVTGAVAAIAGYALGNTTLLVAYKGGTVSQVNGICTSAIGQLGQAMSTSTRNGCSQVALYEQVHGWLIILGVITVAAGIAWSIRRKAAA